MSVSLLLSVALVVRQLLDPAGAHKGVNDPELGETQDEHVWNILEKAQDAADRRSAHLLCLFLEMWCAFSSSDTVCQPSVSTHQGPVSVHKLLTAKHQHQTFI